MLLGQQGNQHITFTVCSCNTQCALTVQEALNVRYDVRVIKAGQQLSTEVHKQQGICTSTAALHACKAYQVILFCTC